MEIFLKYVLLRLFYYNVLLKLLFLHFIWTAIYLIVCQSDKYVVNIFKKLFIYKCVLIDSSIEGQLMMRVNVSIRLSLLTATVLTMCSQEVKFQCVGARLGNLEHQDYSSIITLLVVLAKNKSCTQQE